MPRGDSEMMRAAWEMWVESGRRVVRGHAEQARWREELLAATKDLGDAEEKVEEAKTQLKTCKVMLEVVQQRVNWLAREADGYDEWPWTEE